MTTYKQAGVDIAMGDKLVQIIKQKTRRLPQGEAIGGFAGLYPVPGNPDSYLVAGTDGVGTKLKLAFMLNKHDTIGIDLVAMCVNDLIVCGARPLFFLDYYATGKLDMEVSEKIIDGIVEGCAQGNMALLGGETAEMPGFYTAGEYDLAGFAVGMVDKKDLIDGSTIKAGDVVIGLPSSGVHSNGYSLVRKIFSEAQLAEHAEELLTPTKIYVKALDKIKRKLAKSGQKMKGVAHITGGGLLENMPRILPRKLNAVLNVSAWEVPSVMQQMAKEGRVEQTEMYKTFNMGIGMVVVVDKEATDNVISAQPDAQIIGHITEGENKVILMT